MYRVHTDTESHSTLHIVHSTRLYVVKVVCTFRYENKIAFHFQRRDIRHINNGEQRTTTERIALALIPIWNHAYDATSLFIFYYCLLQTARSICTSELNAAQRGDENEAIERKSERTDVDVKRKGARKHRDANVYFLKCVAHWSR